MATITAPVRRFHAVRGLFRRRMPRLYGWVVNNSLLRSVYRKFRGEVVIEISDRPEDIFTAIYQHHHWDDGESRSGGGSNLSATRRIRAAIPTLVKELDVRTILDAPCGDFYWFKEMDLQLEGYIGGDIVGSLIDENQRKYARHDRTFIVIDLTRTQLPKSDLLLCRDCFIHLSNDLPPRPHSFVQ